MKKRFRRILYITPGCFDKGGISRYNRYQISALRELYGEENIRVFSLLGPEEGDFEEFFKVYWYSWGSSKLSKVVFVLKLITQALLWKPDIIWFGHINLTEILARFQFLNKFKTVLNVYGLEVWSGIRPKVEAGFKAVDHLISDCNFTSNYIHKLKLRPIDNIEIIWDCVDLDKFKYQHPDDFYLKYNLPDPSQHPWILSLGRISHSAAHKGYERLLKVFQKVATKHKDVVLVFVGRGDLIPDLEDQVKQLESSQRIFFSGAVPDTEIAKFYSAADIFTLVSDQGVGRGEGLPMTPLEAMACKTPVIVGNKDGSKEIIINKLNGSCINPFDLDKHAEVILELLNNDELRQFKANSAVKIAHDYFSYEDFKKKHQEFLNKIDVN